MSYYPKSQIKTDLYTKGKEFRIILSQEEYIGYYWKTSKGEYFSGRNPKDGAPLQLEVIPTIPSLKNNTVTYTLGQDNNLYNFFKGVDVSKTFLLPIYIKPSPNDNDYQIGNFTRYFAKKLNQNIYIETSKDIYNNLSNKNASYDYKSYLIFILTWTLVGSSPLLVEQTNRNIIKSTEQRLNINGLNAYLKFNYLEFYKQIS